MPPKPHRSRRGRDERVDAAVEQRVGEANVRKRAAMATVAVILLVVLIRQAPRWFGDDPSVSPGPTAAERAEIRDTAAALLQRLTVETMGGSGELEVTKLTAVPSAKTSKRHFYIDVEARILNDGLGDPITTGIDCTFKSAKGDYIGFEADRIAKGTVKPRRTVTIPPDQTLAVKFVCLVPIAKADEIRSVVIGFKRD
jgi:hypothetical protein